MDFCFAVLSATVLFELFSLVFPFDFLHRCAVGKGNDDDEEEDEDEDVEEDRDENVDDDADDADEDDEDEAENRGEEEADDSERGTGEGSVFHARLLC